MLGKSAISGRSSSSFNNRIFVYEITGLKQNQENDSNSYSFRKSGSIFKSVPYHRLNEEMQRIGKMGGTIVSIQSLEDFKQKQSDRPQETKVEQSESEVAPKDRD